jgi:hypothetical protein
MDLDYCQGISTIVLSFEWDTRKSREWKELAGICEFGETDYAPSTPGRLSSPVRWTIQSI